MSPVTVENVDSRPENGTLPFWLENQQQLRMSFQNVDGTVVVLGHDPNADDMTKSEFQVVLRTEQQDAFITAVREGRQAQLLPSNTNAVIADTTSDAVVIVGPGTGDGSGPKAQYQLSLASNA
jgi:uncharacterized protein YwqG